MEVGRGVRIVNDIFLVGKWGRIEVIGGRLGLLGEIGRLLMDE
jgi:hypothetical protein